MRIASVTRVAMTLLSLGIATDVAHYLPHGHDHGEDDDESSPVSTRVRIRPIHAVWIVESRQGSKLQTFPYGKPRFPSHPPSSKKGGGT